jgi:hypothetical protein
LKTLTSVPATYFASLFSGRFALELDAEGTYSIDRDGRYFHYILNFLRDAGGFGLSSDMTEGEREELAVELQFYGLLDRMMPYYVQDRVGQALLQRACLAGTQPELRTAVAQARELVFEIGSTTPFLTDEFQDLRFVITDRMVNGSPVWAASSEIRDFFMFNGVDKAYASGIGIGNKSHCDEGGDNCFIYNATQIGNTGAAPTDLPLDQWFSGASVTLAPEYASAERPFPTSTWVHAPMRITVVHGLVDGDLTMAAALRQLATLA